MKRNVIGILLGLFLLNLANAQTRLSDSLDAVIRTSIDRYYRSVIWNDSIKKQNLQNLQSEAFRKYGETGETICWNLVALEYYLRFNRDKADHNLAEWVNLKERLNNKYPRFTDDFTMNNDAWFLFQNSTDRKYLQTALKWSKKAVDINPTSGNWLDTYANLLYKLNRKSEAINFEKKALSLEPGNDQIRTCLFRMQQNKPTW